MSETTTEIPNCLSCDVLVPELQNKLHLLTIQKDALTLKVQRLLAEFATIEREADFLEEFSPTQHEVCSLGAVVPLLEYRKLQLESAKSRTLLKVQVEKLRERLNDGKP